MATTISQNSVPQRPAWASALGVVVIVLGVFLAAFQGNEWMKQTVLSAAAPAAGQWPAAVCPEEELEEEGLSLAECEYMVDHARGLVQAMPDWFPSVQKWLAGGGALLAFLSILAGAALVNHSASAGGTGIAVFAALALVDVLQFVAVVNAGPIIRDVYLWSILLWFLIHLMMVAAVLAARQDPAPSLQN